MAVKLNALTSDSYIDISQYRDQHFKVSFIGAQSRGGPFYEVLNVNPNGLCC